MVEYYIVMTYDPMDTPLYKLLLTGKEYLLPKGQVVHALDDKTMVHLISSGYIKRYLITSDGSKSIQVIYGPGDIFPLTPVFKHTYKMDIYRGPEVYYYESMSALKLYSISQTTLEDAIKKDPLIFKDLFYAAGKRLNSYIHRLEDNSLRVANRKVAHQLIYFADIFGERTPEGIVIGVPLTHQTLAEVLNLARETVTVCLAQLQEKGLVDASTRQRLVVKDIGELRRVIR